MGAGRESYLNHRHWEGAGDLHSYQIPADIRHEGYLTDIWLRNMAMLRERRI